MKETEIPAFAGMTPVGLAGMTPVGMAGMSLVGRMRLVGFRLEAARPTDSALSASRRPGYSGRERRQRFRTAMTSFDITRLADILRDASRKETLPRFRRLDRGQVRAKSEAIDLVTEADEAAERQIKADVAAAWPEALFVGEESVAAEPALLDRLDDADFAMVVDPVDGTANFAAGLPLYATMAAVVRRGETIAGIIYDPMGDDWVVAEKGGGAWLRRPDGDATRLGVAKAPALSQMVGHISITFMPSEGKAELLANLAKVRVAANYRVAGHDYRTLASGHCHFVAYNKLMPWDHLGGTLIAEEAGGFARRFDGSRYLPQHRTGGLIVTTDPDTWSLLRREVFTV